MKIIYRIALAELQSLFYSPVAWLILIVFSVQCTFAFTNVLNSMVVQEAMGYQSSMLTSQVYAGMQGFFKVLQNYIYLYIPLLTMGLMSGELSSGSIKLLYSSPVRNSQIILGKYQMPLLYHPDVVANRLHFRKHVRRENHRAFLCDFLNQVADFQNLVRV